MFKKIKDIIIIIVLGAVGSGLWAGIGQPTIGWFTRLVTRLGISISSSYLNFLYKGLGSGGFEDRGSILLSIALIILFAVYFTKKLFSLLMALKLRFIGILLFIIIIIQNLIFSLLIINKVMVSHKANLYIHGSIDIVAPYISQKDRLLLISEYRQISDYNSFKSFESKINKIAEENKFQVKQFTPF